MGCMSKIALGCFLKFGSWIGAGGKCFRAFEMSGVEKLMPRRLLSVGVGCWRGSSCIMSVVCWSFCFSFCC